METENKHPAGGPGKPGLALISLYRRRSLGVKILIGMAVGAVIGAVLGPRAMPLGVIGDVFIRLLLMAAIPLVFFNLAAGITSLPGISVLGRYGVRTIAYYVATTAMALTLGLVVAHVVRPGEGMTLAEPIDRELGAVPNVGDVVLDLFPDNVFEAFAEGNVAQVVVFAVFVGIATLTLSADPQQRIERMLGQVAGLFRKLVDIILQFGPLGVGALAAATIGEYGNRIFGPLAKFVFSVWFAQLLMVFFYMAVLAAVTKRSPLRWLRTTAPLYATTAATCSSLASLVVAMDVAEKRLGIARTIFSFTLPLGAQLNKDGTSIMLAAVLIFTAQAAGVQFTLAEQIIILLVGLLLSEGSGGIPGGGLVIALIFVQAFNLPAEIAGIVAGIYRLIDMGSTTVNVMSDLVWTTALSDIEARKQPVLRPPRGEPT